MTQDLRALLRSLESMGASALFADPDLEVVAANDAGLALLGDGSKLDDLLRGTGFPDAVDLRGERDRWSVAGSQGTCILTRIAASAEVGRPTLFLLSQHIDMDPTEAAIDHGRILAAVMAVESASSVIRTLEVISTAASAALVAQVDMVRMVRQFLTDTDPKFLRHTGDS